MRAVLLLAVVAVVALGVADARRIHKMQAKLQAVTADEVEADVAADAEAEVAVAGPKEDFEAGSSALAGAAALNAAGIAKFFNKNLIRIAADQGKPLRRKVGTYESVGIARTCNNGNCGEWGSDYGYQNGAKGVITAIYTPASGGKAASVEMEFNYWWPSCQSVSAARGRECMAHLKCAAGDGTTNGACAFSTYQECNIPAAYGSGYSLYNSAPSLSQSDAPKYVKRNDMKISAAGLLVVREYYEPKQNQLRHTIRHIRGTFAADAFVAESFGDDGDYLKASPDYAVIRAAEQAKRLTTQEIIAKFFTADNIELARMQGSNVPVKAVIGAYSTSYFAKACDGGVCPLGWQNINLVTGNQFGGEGSIALSCSVPTDLAKAQCSVTLTMKGGYGWEHQTFTSCADVGAQAAAKCSTEPSYFGLQTDRSTDKTFWSRLNFVTSNPPVEHALYFTADRLVIAWKYKALFRVDRDARFEYNNVVYTTLHAVSSPLTDFGAPAKTNCLSKTTADAVLAAANEKKGLKNKIVLQKQPVEDLIKSAPYKTVDDAITKIKGIGPVNVVYVSFMWNFQC